VDLRDDSDDEIIHHRKIPFLPALHLKTSGYGRGWI
jgi:hypothetical protein